MTQSRPNTILAFRKRDKLDNKRRMKRRIQGSFSILKRNGNEEIDRFATIGEIQLARRFVFTGVVPKHFPGMTCVTSALEQRRKIYRAICEWRKSAQENSVRIIARILAYPDAAVQVGAILSALIEPTRNEPGCISYELLQNQTNPADFTFIEAWESNAAIDSHLSAKHVSDALTNLAGLISGEPGGSIQIRRHSVANAREPRN